MKTTPIIAQTTTTQPSQFQDFEPVLAYLKQPGFRGLGIILVLILFLSFLDPKSKGILAEGRWGGKKELERAKVTALKQMAEGKQTDVACWIGDRNQSEGTIYLTNMEQGTLVLGKSGTGKTYSVIDPLFVSALKQGHPIMLYDRKFPEQLSTHVALAAQFGYEIDLFVPGYPQSGRCNPLDLVDDPEDFMAHMQLAKVINNNYKMSQGTAGSTSTNNDFFERSGDSTLAALMMLAQATPYPDLLTALEFSKVEDIAMVVKRNRHKVSRHVYNAFLQLIQTSGSPPTLSSIFSTTAQSLMQLVNKSTEPYICGKSTIPLDLTGKKLVVFGFDSDKRDAVSPLVTTIMHLIAERNLKKKRTEPLFMFLDEVASALFTNLYRWLTEYRSFGLCIVMGCQNIAQLRKTYGKDLADIIIGNIGNYIVFNPGDNQSAQDLSTALGELEIKYNQTSRGYSGGKSNTNKSEQRQKKLLQTVAQIRKFGRGKAVLLCQGNASEGEAYVPLLKKFKPVGTYDKDRKISQRLWKKKLNQKFIARNNIVPVKIKPRLKAIKTLLPVGGGGDEDDLTKLLGEIGA